MPALPPTGCRVRVGWIYMPAEPSEPSEYLVAAGGISETCKEGKQIFPVPANGWRPPKAPFRWAAGAGWGLCVGCPRTIWTTRLGPWLHPPCLSSPIILALIRVLIYSTGSTPALPGRPWGPLTPAADDKAYAKGTIIHPPR